MSSSYDLWSIIVQNLSEHISSTAVHTWFDEVEVISLENSTLTLYCPDLLKQRSIVTYHMAVLEQTVRDLFSENISVVFLSDAAYKARKQKPDIGLTRVSGTYTFENFVVGDSNRMAYTAAKSAAEGFSEYCNPLVIFSKPGLGKTHLLNAIADKVQELDPDASIVYLKSDNFTNELIKAIHDGTNEEFRNKYRTANVFLMDDIQFISGKKQTQIEFFNTFETLYEANCRIVVTIDRHPRDLTQLDERIRNRFEGGLIVEINEPEFDTRFEIVKSKAAQRDLSFSDDVAAYVAERVTGDVRRLEGVLNKLKAFLDIETHTTITNALETVVSSALGDEVPSLKPESILKDVAQHFGIDVAHIKSKSRNRNVTTARQAAMYVMCKGQGLSTTQVGKYMGRDHSTVNHAIKTIQAMLDSDPDFEAQINKILNK